MMLVISILMERIGPGTNYNMPHGAALLADKGYGDVVPLAGHNTVTLTSFAAISVVFGIMVF